MSVSKDFISLIAYPYESLRPKVPPYPLSLLYNEWMPSIKFLPKDMIVQNDKKALL